ncbi:MAG TPA: PIN domain-containing protein [Candidatus Binataceae bacterium]|nr:PIN domain-containing protein [Candidatus Binataceae bacterium]
MKVFFDTRVTVAASEQSHPYYQQARLALDRVAARKDRGYISVHTIAEVYAVLMRLPVQPRIHPAEAAQILQTNILPFFESVSIIKKTYAEALRLVVAGGAARRSTMRCWSVALPAVTQSASTLSI